MQSRSNTTVQILQSPAFDQRIEVSIESSEGVEHVVLRHATWTEGLGWCCQKTIRLDGEHLDDLHRALTVARHRLNRRRVEAGQLTGTGQVIQLPTLA
ncbi:MAG TPA: hypothetical protein VD966_01715 [Pyrinomonadaceae bacterium]|nr:hypothetical protein [Pyrinomonadaceae bacterium]